MSKKIKVSIDLELTKAEFIQYYGVTHGAKLATRLYRKKNKKLLDGVFGEILRQLERKVLNTQEDIKEIAIFKREILGRYSEMSNEDLTDEAFEYVGIIKKESPGQ